MKPVDCFAPPGDLGVVNRTAFKVGMVSRRAGDLKVITYRRKKGGHSTPYRRLTRVDAMASRMFSVFTPKRRIRSDKVQSGFLLLISRWTGELKDLPLLPSLDALAYRCPSGLNVLARNRISSVHEVYKLLPTKGWFGHLFPAAMRINSAEICARMLPAE